MSYTHLTEKERYVISHLKIADYPLREIARRLGRHHTSISREIKRNKPDYADDAVYWYTASQPTAEERKHKPRSHCRQDQPRLVKYVENKLKLDWPPEVIAAKLRIDYPLDESMRISHETIYRWIYIDANQGGDLHLHLRRRHKRRRRQTRYGSGRRFIPGRVPIGERPEIVNTRERFGDWEGDSLEGAKGTGGIATHVERKSRFLLAAKLADKKATTMTVASVDAFHKVPSVLRQTLTVDNGKEFSQFKELEHHTGLAVFFADPYAAWQRGSNENTNGILRFYYPKGTDFSKVSKRHLERVIRRINNRPRKCLNYRSPHQVMQELVGGALVT